MFVIMCPFPLHAMSWNLSRCMVETTKFTILGVECEDSGEPMVAVSWQEMMCPSTEQKELRKVAKVV